MRQACILCFFILLSLLADSVNAQTCTLPEPFDANVRYSQTVYVSPDGTDDATSGSESQPYRTLQFALRQAVPGTRILLTAGEHHAGIHASNVKGTAEAPILITGPADGGDAVISGGNTALQLSDPEYVVLQNFVVEKTSGNGINIDDAGDYETPAHHVILRDLQVRDIGPEGNRDGIKLSGLDHFRVERCVVERAGSGGSGIDMVGCHEGVIAHNQFRENGSNSIQAKGGTANILIYANRFENGGLRAVNMGGSTGLEFFRPIDAPYEASNITVVSNIFIGSQTPIAFVGCQYGLFAHNVIDRPGKWVARILQETTGDRFVQSSNNVFANNIVRIDNSVSTLVNIGPNTKPDTFRFVNNLFTHTENQNFQNLNLPGLVLGTILQEEPQFENAEDGNYRLQPTSPAIGNGVSWQEAIGNVAIDPPSVGDWEGNCWQSPPTIGIYEEVRQTGCIPWLLNQ